MQFACATFFISINTEIKKYIFLYVYDVNVNKYVFGKKNLLSTNIGQKNSNQLRVSNDECTDSA